MRPLEFVRRYSRPPLLGVAACEICRRTKYRCSRPRSRPTRSPVSAIGTTQAAERCDATQRRISPVIPTSPACRRLCARRSRMQICLHRSHSICSAVTRQRTESHNTAGLMRRRSTKGFSKPCCSARGRDRQLPHVRLRRTGLPGPTEPAGVGAGTLQSFVGCVPQFENADRGGVRSARDLLFGPPRARTAPPKRSSRGSCRAMHQIEALLPDLRRNADCCFASCRHSMAISKTA